MSGKYIFFDKYRDPPDDGSWHVCRSTDEVISWISSNGMPSHVSLDFDISSDIGTAFVAWLTTRRELPVISYHGNSRTNADILVSILKARC